MFVDEIMIEMIPELTRDAKDSRSPVNTKKKVSINPRNITQDRERQITFKEVLVCFTADIS